MSEDIVSKIQSQINENDIIIYMKGTPEMPQCGFSAQTVGLFKSYGVPFTSVDVLEDPEMRQSIKEFSNWPTIPQVYIKGQFVGGCDICNEMHASGELEKMAKSAVAG
ncbi:MAG: Grx4 family monothiol glutaredoxin [Thermodesulfobacteriota bacterium]